MWKLSSLACGLVLAGGGLAHAQFTTTTTTTTAPAGTEVRRVSQLLGSTVHLQGTDNYGKVEDIILGDNGAPAYMVVSNGGRYGMFPWSGANINYGRRAVTYAVTPQAVQPLLFEQNAWPNVADQQFTTRTTQVFPAGGVVTSPVPVETEKIKIKVKPNGTIKEKIRER